MGGVPHGTRLRPFLAARLSLRFDDASADLDTTQEWEALYGPLEDGLDLDTEVAVDYDERDLVPTPPSGATFAEAPAEIQEESFRRKAATAIQQRVTDAQALTIFRNRELKLFSRPGETPEAFAARADAEAQAQADREAAKIRDRLEAKRDRLEAALETARRRADELATDEKTRTTTELLAGAGTILNVLLGGRGSARTIARAGGAIGSAASRRGMTARTGERRRTAEEKAEATEQTLEELEQEIVDEVGEIDAEWTAKADEIEELEIRLESSDVRVVELKLVWVPTA